MISKKSLQEHDKNNQRALLTIFSRWGIPHSMLDIGSGSGIMTKTARSLGVDAIGIDLLGEAPDIQHDLNKPINMGKHFDLITTIETAEHIENEGNFLKTINAHTKEGTILVFTAAVPGQKGYGHVNCQPKEYWRQKLEAMGYRYLEEDTNLVAHWWRWSAGGLSAWLSPNLQIFKRGA